MLFVFRDGASGRHGAQEAGGSSAALPRRPGRRGRGPGRDAGGAAERAGGLPHTPGPGRVSGDITSCLNYKAKHT